MQRPSPSRVTIALCTRNGADHLEEQLASYVAQTHDAWDLWVSDDGSTDATRDLIDRFAARHGEGRTIRMVAGPQQGLAMNFLSLLCHPDLPAQPVALSDQDDVWHPEKLALGLAGLSGPGPRLYGAQSIHTDATLTPTGGSHGGDAPSFGNALVQNIVSGHSAMLDAEALALVRRAGVPQGIPYHDWWLYQLVSGAGGTVVVRSDRVVLYRQHGGNAMGSHQGINARMARVAQVFGRAYGSWIAANTDALRAVSPLLTPETRAILKGLYEHPPRPGPARARAFARHGLHRQGYLGTMVLYMAVLAGRV